MLRSGSVDACLVAWASHRGAGGGVLFALSYALTRVFSVVASGEETFTSPSITTFQLHATVMAAVIAGVGLTVRSRQHWSCSPRLRPHLQSQKFCLAEWCGMLSDCFVAHILEAA